jgi:prepilin-type N-terminal cleavage/methylation domain-containing protein
MKMNLKKGFTLIELLVVVAIIGILASVVLASLNTARAKGSDAAIKANLDNMRAQGAIYYDTNNSYGVSNACVMAAAGTTTGTCVGLATDPTTLAGIKAAAAAAGASVTLWTNLAGDAYVIESPLKAAASTWWCVDSAGKSLQESVTLPAGNITSATCN